MNQKKTYNSWFLGTYICAFFLVCLVFTQNIVKAENNKAINYKIDLYGHEVSLQFSAPSPISFNTISQEQISAQIKQFESADLSRLIEQMDNYSTAFGMDDMAYLLFTQKVSKAICGLNQNAKIFEYALLKSKGYKMLMGYSESELTVYGFLDFKVLNGTYITYQGLVYTDLSFDQNLEPCEEKLLENPAAGRAIMINENRPPLYNALEKKYKLHFDFESITYFYNGTLNQSLAAYYQELPDIEFGPIYLNYQLSDKAKNSLVKAIKADIEGLRPMQQIDFLLSFAQQAFAYQKDIDAIGKEKFAFPEEVLSNNYADCEDKSVLFAYLVKEIYKMQTVALVYFQEHHLNVAVAINSKDGYSFVYNNQKYIVCEPSGIGFVPGDNIYDLKKASIVNW